MKSNPREYRQFLSYIQDLLQTEEVHSMDKYIQHGNTSTLTHCLMVAYYSYYISNRLPFSFDSRSVVRGALLHDFYLYDWHIPEYWHKLHGFRHPGFALRNANRLFELNSIEKDIIEKHMWPMTLTKMPICREAFLVCMIDKICSLGETFYMIKPPNKLMKFSKRYMKSVKAPALER